MNPNSEENLKDRILNSRKLRRAVTRRSHYWFFNIFLPHYVAHPFAPFHRDMFALSENTSVPILAVMAFRGSGKSTILNLSYTLWGILGVQQKKCVVIVSKTQQQAKNHFASIRDEIKNNSRLRADLGPFEEDSTGSYSIELPAMGAKIIAVSREQSIRGIRYGPHRPDLIICDDIEDSLSVQSEAEREATYQWFLNEVIPAGSSSLRVVILGNFLHMDAFLMRLKKAIEDKAITGAFRAYPLLDDSRQILWQGKYPDDQAIQALQAAIPSAEVWEREYLLKSVIRPASGVVFILEDGDEGWEEELEKDLKTVALRQVQRLGRYAISVPRVVKVPGVFLTEKAHQEFLLRT